VLQSSHSAVLGLTPDLKACLLNALMCSKLIPSYAFLLDLFQKPQRMQALDAMSIGFLSLGLEVLDDIALAQQLSSALLPGCNTTLNQIGTVPERQIEGPPILNCEYSNFQYIKCKTPYFYSSLIRGPCCLSAFKLVAFCQAVLPRWPSCSTHLHSWL